MQQASATKLNSEWSFWYASRKEKDHHIPYDARLTEVYTFNTLEEFFNVYLKLKTIDQIERNNDIALFKKGYQPLWESCPDSGFWFYRFKRTDDDKDINFKWEKILFALIGEQIDEVHILGAVLSIRGRETIIELWFNFFGYEKIKNHVAQKFREILSIDSGETVYFKDIKQSLIDKSTLRNAETYSFRKQRKFTYN
jgi:translation initiation factor 4E